MADRFILTLSCADVRGIVAAVTGFLAEHHCFIIESAQFGDPSTDRFFMRTEFSTDPQAPKADALKTLFQEKVGARFGMEWEMHDKSRNARTVILVSRFGHCLNDLLYRHRTQQLAIDIPAVVSNHEDFRNVVEREGIPFHYLPGGAKQEAELMQLLEKYAVDVTVLARYMQILSPKLSAALKGKAINIHHSFLPSFKGARPYHQAYDRGVKLIGATAHYVTDVLDEGPIIDQEVARVDHAHSPEQMVAIGRDIECMTLSRALKYHTEHRVLLNGAKTVVFR